MKLNLRILLFAFLTLLCDLKAQDYPISFDRNMLANSRGLPNTFLIFSQDTSVAVLFNPARGAAYSKKFIYANYLPSSNSPLEINKPQLSYGNNYYVENPHYQFLNYSGSAISVATLLDINGSKWLMQISNNALKSKIEQSKDGRSFSDNYVQLANSTSDYTSDLSQSLSSLKISKVGKLNDKFFSLGIYALIFPYERNENSSKASNKYTPPDSYGDRNEIYSQKVRILEKKSNFVAGFEYALAAEDWDLITGITVEKDILNSEISFDFGKLEVMRNSSSINIRSQSNVGNKYIDNSPITFGINGYYQHKADIITSNDHYFLSTNLYRSTGNIKYNQFSQGRYTVKTNATYTANDTTDKLLSQNENVINYGATISFGYLVKGKLIDLDFIVGINPHVGYYAFKNIYPYSNSFSEYYSDYFSYYTPGISNIYDFKVWSASVQFPIYLNFTPVHWFSVYGGLNYYYKLEYWRRNTYSPVESVYTSKLPMSNADTYQSESYRSSYLNATNDVYAGFELRHESGLRVQSAFKGTLSNFTSWNISIGYIF
ncbi:MAG: hypothetical protein HYZ10_16225 [Ignavibacteriales bacterium]|nr:hypothetical protein [Ignavibacteriales bacterium]